MDKDKQKRILIIEDNVAFRKILKIRLESNRYEVFTAEDGLEGLNIARRIKPDLIILDLMLPGMNGHKVCRLLKFDVQYRHIPIIILTSRDMDEDERLARESRADAFIVKITEPHIILEIIQDLLEDVPVTSIS